MQTIEYHTKDKSDWGDGPWQNEPDKRQWRDEATGLPCLIVRNWGAWCGYVGVSRGHPLYGASYDDDRAEDIDVHGGLTFAGPCRPGNETHAICHKVEPGEDDDVWWLGFDCNQCGDFDPDMARGRGRGLFRTPCEDETYRDIAYVTKEVQKLAAQLVERL